MAGLSTRLSVRMTVATSPSGVSRPYWAAITWCPSVWSGAITLLKHEPSAQRPWQKTMLGLLFADMDSSFRENRRSLALRRWALQRCARRLDRDRREAHAAAAAAHRTFVRSLRAWPSCRARPRSV